MRKNLAISIFFVFILSHFINVSYSYAQDRFSGTPPTTNAQVPRFEDANCAVPLPKGENARCGYLVVPESRKIKNDKTVRLPIVILKSESPNPQPDPILRTFGGPGASSMNLVRSRPSSPWLKNRDLIIFEQRGTKYSQPALNCPEVGETNAASAKQKLDAKLARAKEIQAAKACYNRLTNQGINLSAYNSAESAADIEDLRRVLKLEKINLWGLSYSTRLMLEVMRDYPNGIRSVVLESTMPPEINYDEVGVDGIVRVFNVLFANCKADADCAKAYPNLENEFYESVARLNKKPIVVDVKDSKTGETVNLGGNDFVTWLVDYLFSDRAASIVEVPLVIHNLFQGNYNTFKKYAGEKTGSAGTGLGMRYSVWCSEEFPFENMRKIKAQSSLYPRLNGYEVMALPDICGIWKVQPAKTIENKPVRSDIPTLVLTAEYDAYTPPAWGQGVAKNLKNSFLFEVPWTGHGPAFSVPCLADMIVEFIDDPKTLPKSECLAKTKQRFKFTVK
jgi:Predicted hydrolases or acyltransferases (alpha/beta hydrolase superfamily)